MDSRPIGVFDSGLGGLTAVRELRRLLPGEKLIYFGDTGRVPYGGRSRETLIKYARQDVAFLRQFDLKSIVIACGTVSATALNLLSEENTLPIRGVVEPAAKAAIAATKTGKIGLIGTAATIRSGAYERALAVLDPTVTVTARACPLFVPLVENGRIHSGDVVIETVCEEYLADIKAAGVDTLILGCTHYPLLTEVIGACMGPGVTLIDVGAACARRVADELAAGDTLAPEGSQGELHCYVSDTVDGFSSLASRFLGEDITGHVERVDIDKY